MRAYHMILVDASAQRRRVDFDAESPDQAFLIARNEKDGVEVELWEDDRLLARMTKSGANIWKIGGTGERYSPARRATPGMSGVTAKTAADGFARNSQA